MAVGPACPPPSPLTPSSPSPQVLAVASDEGRVKCFNTTNGEPMIELSGHDDAVQAVLFDHGGQYLYSCGSDNTFRVWG